MDHAAAWKDAVPFLDAAINRLPDKEQQILVQRFYAGMKFREIPSLPDGSVPDVIENAKSMDLTPKELAGAIKRVTNLGGLSSDPVGMIEWAAEVHPDSVPATLVDWAEQDLEGATTWLGRQSPSPTRDQAIARFATKASKLDPESAAQWAAEIQNESLRNKTLEKIAGPTVP